MVRSFLREYRESVFVVVEPASVYAKGGGLFVTCGGMVFVRMSWGTTCAYVAPPSSFCVALRHTSANTKEHTETDRHTNNKKNKETSSCFAGDWQAVNVFD